MRARTKLTQSIGALLLRQDIADPPMTVLSSTRGVAWLKHLTVPGEAHTVLQQLIHALEAVDEEARAAEAVVKAHAATDPIALALQTLRGIGPVLALTLRAAIGAIERFALWTQLASSAGLVPRVSASGGHRYHGRITREGSPWLRGALVEAAVHAIARPDATGKWARRLALRTGVHKARVALARQGCKDLVHLWPKA